MTKYIAIYLFGPSRARVANSYTLSKLLHLTSPIRNMHKMRNLNILVYTARNHKLTERALSHNVVVKKDGNTGNHVLFAAVTTKPINKATAVTYPEEKGLLLNPKTKKQQHFQATPQAWVLSDKQLKNNFDKLPDVEFTDYNNEKFAAELYDKNPTIFAAQQQIRDTHIVSTTKDVYAQSIVEMIKVEKSFKQEGKTMPSAIKEID